MPIIESTNSTAPVFSPEANYDIAKYLDLTKFISLLQKKSLFFCRLDRLEDKFEGKTASGNYDVRLDWIKSSNTLFENPLCEKEIEKEVNSLYELGEKMKSLVCVNCWNKFDGESAALWKIYSDFNKGIMIKSSIE